MLEVAAGLAGSTVTFLVEAHKNRVEVSKCVVEIVARCIEIKGIHTEPEHRNPSKFLPQHPCHYPSNLVRTRNAALIGAHRWCARGRNIFSRALKLSSPRCERSIFRAVGALEGGAKGGLCQFSPLYTTASLYAVAAFELQVASPCP